MQTNAVIIQSAEIEHMETKEVATSSHHAALFKFAACLLALAASPAFAQISKVNTVMENVQTVLVGVAVTVFTVAIMWAGFKLAFQHAKWSEISNIVIGGILVGGAAGIAAWLID